MAQQNQEDLQKQQQMMEQQQMMWRRSMMLQQAVSVIRSLDKKTVLDALSKQVGSNLFCPNQFVAQQLSQKIAALLEGTPEFDDMAVNVQNVLLNSVNLSNAIRSQMMYSSMNGMQQNGGMMGMNPMMMGGMSMGMPGMMGAGMGMPMGMNMGMGMNGFGMMGGFGMNGMYGMNQFAAQQPASDNTDEAARKIEIAKQYIKNYVFQADPLIFLTMLGNQLGLQIDFSNDKTFEDLIVQALYCALMYMSNTNPMIFQQVFYVIQQLYATDYYSKMNSGNKDGNQQQNQFNMFGMNPMMGAGMGFGMMNPMMGMGMNMGGMMTGMDQGAGMFGMMNPMMGAGMGMPNMMGGMQQMPGMGMGMQMPGMSGGTGCLF